ncbi:MAG: HEPN domain-containing protein [Roseovarius sp.]|jgi:HEPN domain-containing protein|nr:HEPN domain-containing protein [Roseovarius sp.]
MSEAVTQSIPPLFEATDERFERVDQWSFPKSVSIGWPVDIDPTPELFHEYSARYYESSRCLCTMVTQNHIEDYVASFPIIFLYRHSVELALKGIILRQTGSTIVGHELGKLLSGVSGLPDWAEAWITELDELDARSTALRYPDTNVRSFEIGALMTDWEAKTEKLHSLLIALSQR